MPARKLTLTAMTMASLMGCQMSSGVVKMGSDTYSVSVNAAPARGGVSGAKGAAYAQANAECQKQGKQLLTVNEQTGYAFPANGTVDLTSRCLASGDPALTAQSPGHPRD
jgi:hypothetical protein